MSIGDGNFLEVLKNVIDSKQDLTKMNNDVDVGYSLELKEQCYKFSCFHEGLYHYLFPRQIEKRNKRRVPIFWLEISIFSLDLQGKVSRKDC